MCACEELQTAIVKHSCWLCGSCFCSTQHSFVPVFGALLGFMAVLTVSNTQQASDCVKVVMCHVHLVQQTLEQHLQLLRRPPRAVA